MRVQERDLQLQRSAVRLRLGQRRRRPGGVVRRVLLPHRRPDHGPERLPTGAAGPGQAVRLRRGHRDRAAVRIRRHGARRSAEAEVCRPRCHQRGRGHRTTSSATTSSSRSVRACCRRRRSTWRRGTAPWRTAASCSSRRSSATIWQPGTPDGEPGFADPDRGIVFSDESAPTLIRQVPMPPSIRTPLVRGLRRVTTGPGKNGRSTTAEELFTGYPGDAIQVAGKTGTAQGQGNYPWNDSSVFTGFAVDAAPTTSCPTTSTRTSSRRTWRRPATDRRRRLRSSSACSSCCPASSNPTRSYRRTRSTSTPRSSAPSQNAARHVVLGRSRR